MRRKSSSHSIVAMTTAGALLCVIAASTALAAPLPGRTGSGDASTLLTPAQGSDDARRDKKGPPPGKDGKGPLAAAAKELGISERQLADAVGPRPPNIERGAKILGIQPEKLRAVLEKHRPPGKK